MKNEIQKVNKGSFAVDITAKLEDFNKKISRFGLKNLQLGIDLKITTTGKIQSRENEAIVFDSLNCVIVAGHSQFVLWGEEGTPEEGKLLIDEKNIDDAHCEYEKLVMGGIEGIEGSEVTFEKMYTANNINERFVLTILGEDGNVYSLNMSKSSKREFEKYVKLCYGTVNETPEKVITCISVQAMSYEKNNWSAYRFKFIEKL